MSMSDPKDDPQLEHAEPALESPGPEVLTTTAELGGSLG